MNNRPLTYLSEESDLKALTPSSFLQDLLNNDVPDLDKINKTNINKRYKYVQRLRQILKERFRTEYLGFLRSSIPKRLDQIKVGDVVLIGREDKKTLLALSKSHRTISWKRWTYKAGEIKNKQRNITQTCPKTVSFRSHRKYESHGH
ncbi:bel12-ag transposon polyprotein [Trichonephila clavata]|uniref:Bel12-ag transposon polyprotein n=1 Tax=Trichonephila clavata TaxID=2740835 RepID=A0A8X6L8M7_TRICU|nr:bel12-ag transposon polyprotein [Trichonephila clavata]